MCYSSLRPVQTRWRLPRCAALWHAPPRICATCCFALLCLAHRTGPSSTRPPATETTARPPSGLRISAGQGFLRTLDPPAASALHHLRPQRPHLPRLRPRSTERSRALLHRRDPARPMLSSPTPWDHPPAPAPRRARLPPPSRPTMTRSGAIHHRLQHPHLHSTAPEERVRPVVAAVAPATPCR